MTSPKPTRRNVVLAGASLGTIVLAESLLSACRSRGFNAPARSGVKSNFFSETFLAHYDRILATPEAYADPFIPGFDPAATGIDAKDAKVQHLLKMLILIRLKAGAMGLFDELRDAGRKIVNPVADAGVLDKPIAKAPGLLAPTLVLTHAAVTGLILDPGNTITLKATDARDTLKIAPGTVVDAFRLLPYHPEMPLLTGHYILCDDDVKRHDAEKALSWAEAVRADDAEKVVASIRARAESLVKAALAKPGADGRIDVVRDLARWLPVGVVTDYFGVPSGDKGVTFTFDTDAEAALFGKKKGDSFTPSESHMYVWIANSFRNLFLNLGKDAGLTAAGRRSGAQLTWYLARLVDREIKSPSGADTVLARFVALAKGKGASSSMFDPTENPVPTLPDGSPNALAGVVSGLTYRIASQMAGSVAGAGVTVEEAIARVFNVLLLPKNAAPLKKAVELARAGDTKALRPYVTEALRFQPQAEILPRVCVEGATIEGTSVPPGALVFASLYSAMHDDAAVGTGAGKAPAREFDPTRASNAYLHFGFGRHECLGKYIAPVEMVEAFRAVAMAAPTGSITLESALTFSDDGPFTDRDANEGVREKADGTGPYAHSLLVRLA